MGKRRRSPKGKAEIVEDGTIKARLAVNSELRKEVLTTAAAEPFYRELPGLPSLPRIAEGCQISKRILRMPCWQLNEGRPQITSEATRGANQPLPVKPPKKKKKKFCVLPMRFCKNELCH